MDSLSGYEENKFDDLIINKELPHSPINNYSYGELLNLNKEYTLYYFFSLKFLEHYLKKNY